MNTSAPRSRTPAWSPASSSALNPAYPGWHCAGTTVVRAARAKYVTVNESVMLPGPDALIAPEWLPWKERLRRATSGWEPCCDPEPTNG